MKSLERKVFAARLSLLWERLWPAFFPAMMVAGLFLLASLVGIFDFLPQTAHMVALAGFALAFIVSLKPVAAVHWPDRAAGLRHLEANSSVPHRPASSYEDTLSPSNDDPLSRRIWLRHKQRLSEMLRKLRPAWPVSRLARQDPFALRAALLLSIVVAASWSGGDWQGRLTNAFVPSARSTVPVWLDAWVKPPDYTAMPPIFLSGQNTIQSISERERVEVPTGSEIVVRLNGAETPQVVFEADTEDGVAAEQTVLAMEPAEGGVHELRTALRVPGTVSVRDGNETLESWSFSIIPDAPPRIDLVGEIERTVNQAVRFIYSVSDDYGVASADARFVLSDEQDGEIGVSSSTLLMMPPPNFNIILPSLNPRSAEQMVYQDMTAHPWAGLVVEMTLLARDQAGNVARSDPFTFRLPERSFSEPLARAVIEQRRHLIRDVDQQPRVALALDALTLYPDELITSSGIYLGIRHALNRVRAVDDDALMDSIDLLWELALAIEDGDLSVAERELRSAQRALQEALARDASPEEIAELMERLRDAVRDYMTALAERAQRNQQAGDQSQEGGQEVSAEDFANMLDTIENLARAGANDAAQDMLAQLQNMLENMQAGRSQRGMSERDAEMARLLEQLGQLMGEQQELMDQTFQTPDSDSAEPGGRGGAQSDFEELAELQDTLAQTLEDILSGLERRGVEGPSSLDQAGDSMQEALDALRQADRRGAVDEQGDALDQMREGAQAMAQEMLQGNGTQGALGRHGRGGNDPNRDPLGRPLNSSGPELGLSTELPTEIEMQRARKILRELQERVGDRQRPPVELEYLDRLLERF